MLEDGCTRTKVDFRGWVEGLVQDEMLQFWGCCLRHFDVLPLEVEMKPQNWTSLA